MPDIILDCEYARVEAVVVRVCASTLDGGIGIDETSPEEDDELRARTRDVIAPLLERARAEQGLA